LDQFLHYQNNVHSKHFRRVGCNVTLMECTPVFSNEGLTAELCRDYDWIWGGGNATTRFKRHFHGDITRMSGVAKIPLWNLC